MKTAEVTIVKEEGNGFRRYCLAAIFVLWNAAGLSAQVVTGSIEGRVTDSTGAVIPGVAIQVQNLETGFSRNIQADTAGRYAVRNLPLGTYTVTGQMTGFRTEVRSGITLTVAREAVVNLELGVGTVQERVEVVGEAPVVETTNATLSGLVSTSQVQDLPLNGRSWDDLALLQPGVVNQPSGPRNQIQGGGHRLSSNGARADGAAYLLDGTITNDHSSQGSSSAARQNLGVEAIREFRVLTHNFSAEYGRNAGVVVSVVTRSGTNEFHGSLYEFWRNNVLDARNFFNVANAPEPSPLPPFRRNQFGASLGGPLVRDKIFFFANYEGLRERRGVTVIATVPDENARKGLIPDPATGGMKQVTVSSAIQPYLAIWPLPNGRNFGSGAGEFATDFSSQATEDFSMKRMDFRLSDSDSLYWRYVFNPSAAVNPRPTPVFIDGEEGTNHFVTLNETHVFSATALNEFRFAFNRTVPATTTGAGIKLDPSLDFIPGEGFGTISFTEVTGQAATGITQFGTRGPAPQVFTQNLFQVTDSVSYVRGAHSFKTGFDFQRIQLNTQFASRRRGEYVFAGLEPLLTAKPSRFQFHFIGTVDGLDSTAERGWRHVLLGWFVQDDIRVSPKLTLNLGFRHEFVTAPNEVNGRMAHLVDPVKDRLGTKGPPFVPDKTNLAPRAGLAWDPTGSGKTSIRLGAGLFHNHLLGRTWYFFDDSLFGRQFQVANPPFPLGASTGFSPTPLTNRIIDDPDTPTMIHYNLQVQRQLAPTMSLRAGYVGSHGYNLHHPASINIRTPEILPDGSKFFPACLVPQTPCPPAQVPPRRNRNFTDIRELRTDGQSNYNSFQAELQKALSHGLQIQASYTLSKTHADSDSISSSQIRSTNPSMLDIDDLGRDYSLSVYDQRHTVVLNGLYRMPWDNLLSSGAAKAILGGWSIGSIFTYGSGFPLNIQVGFNNSKNLDGEQPDRPDLAPGFSNNPIEGVTAGCGGVNPATGKTLIPAGQKLGTPDLWFDPCAFSLPREGTFGNLGRNTVRGPKLYSVDFTLRKATPLWGERANLEFRAEFFNLLNNTYFGEPLRLVFNSATRAYAGNEGRITETFNEGREIQFGLKLVF